MLMCVQKDSEAVSRPRRNNQVLWFISDICHGQKWQHMYYIPELVFCFLNTFSVLFPSKCEKDGISLEISNCLLNNKVL